MARKQIVADINIGTAFGNYPPPDNGMVDDINANFIELYASIGGGGGFFPGFLAPPVLAAGLTADYNPGGTWPTGVSRLDITPGSGGSTLTGLVVGSDGQSTLIFNPSSTDNLTLANQNVGSSAANRFQSAGDFVLPPGDGVLIVYYAGTVNRWRIFP